MNFSNPMLLGIAAGAGALLLLMGGGSSDPAEAELKKWVGLRKTDPQAVALIRNYWAGISQPYPGASVPWSGAFIHYVAPGLSLTAGSHMLYAGMAKAGRGAYRVFPSGGLVVKPGDIILRNRSGGQLTFQDIGRGHADSHADVVTVVQGSTARAIGGNKRGGLVGVENYALSPGGSLTDPRAFAILRRS